MTSAITAAVTTLNGNPDAIRATGRGWRTAAMACAAAAAQVGAVAVIDGFLGDEAGTWQQRLEPDTSAVLGTLATARDIVGGALVSYADVLEACQQELRTLAVHRAEAGVALDRWRTTPTAEPDLIDSATQTLHDLDARSTAILARHDAAIRACCVQIDRATAMAPGHVAGVHAGITSVRAGGGPGRYRQSSNAVMAGFSLAQPAQLSAIGPFHATDNPQDMVDGDTKPTPPPWIDPALQATYRERFYNACRGMQTGATTPGDNTDAFCDVQAKAIVESRENILIGLRAYPFALTPEEVYGLDDALADGWDFLTDIMIGGCKEGGSIGACLFDIATAPIPIFKGAKAVKVGVELVEDGADVVKAGETAVGAERVGETSADVRKFGSEADEATAATKASDPDGVPLSVLREDAGRIANGHAYGKHVIEKGEFPGIHSQQEFAEHIADVIAHGERRRLRDGRVAYWKDDTFVIRNPRDPDGGTAFRPDDGYEYFDTQR